MDYLEYTRNLLTKLLSPNSGQRNAWYRRDCNKSDSTSCLLCDKVNLDMHTKHFGSACHQEKVKELERHLRRTLHLLARVSHVDSGPSQDLRERVKLLGLGEWREDVMSSEDVFQYVTGCTLFLDLLASPLLHLSQVMVASGPFRPNAVLKLERYEDLERLALLQLAVWKSECLKQMPVGDYFVVNKWLMSGWKACKAKHRESNAMTIVIASVRPFLTQKPK
jgi:hypothetical protein